MLQAIIHKINIEYQGQRVYFQIPLPDNYESIVGIETSSKLDHTLDNAHILEHNFGYKGFFFAKSLEELWDKRKFVTPTIGTLRLSSQGKPFIDQDLYLMAYSMNTYDVSSTRRFNREVELNFKSLEQGLSVPYSGIVEGYYKDEILKEGPNLKPTYTLTIVLWLRKHSKTSKDENINSTRAD